MSNIDRIHRSRKARRGDVVEEIEGSEVMLVQPVANQLRTTGAADQPVVHPRIGQSRGVYPFMPVGSAARSRGDVRSYDVAVAAKSAATQQRHSGHGFPAMDIHAEQHTSGGAAA